jgi:glutamyl-Q tRNA(Asp) synthetase
VYIGRFAPSPSGPLHFGSLIAALGSYLDAKAHKGKWLVRIEDIDPQREQKGAAALILQSLEEHHLWWDDDVLYQSRRYAAYESVLQTLIDKNLIYSCNCTRKNLATMGGIYDGRCRNQKAQGDLATLDKTQALRLRLHDSASIPAKKVVQFDDLFQGSQTQDLCTQMGDPILKRRDGLYAYSLAVVVDDSTQGITHIIRGSDLLEVTGSQLYLFDLLDQQRPRLGHLPLALDARGQKLSKQNHAKPIIATQASENLWHALVFLGQNPSDDLVKASSREIIDWGIAHWQRTAVPRNKK